MCHSSSTLTALSEAFLSLYSQMACLRLSVSWQLLGHTVVDMPERSRDSWEYKQVGRYIPVAYLRFMPRRP